MNWGRTACGWTLVDTGEDTVELEVELMLDLVPHSLPRFRLRLAEDSPSDPRGLREFCSLVEIFEGEVLLDSSSSVKGESGAQGLLNNSNDLGRRGVPENL